LPARIRWLDGGRVSDWWHSFVSGNVLFTAAALPEWVQHAANAFASDGGVARGAQPAYAFGATRVEFDAVPLPVPTGPWRGLGAAPNVCAVEAALDVLAARAGSDALSFRIAHLQGQPRLVACLQRVAAMAGWGRPLPRGRALGLGCAPYKDASWAAVIADVEADERDAILVRGLWCAQDSGRVVDADRVRAQAEGNLVWAIGSALTEELPLAGGAVGATSFADYRLPTLLDVPRVLEVALVAPPAGAGYGGAGETAIGPALAAIVNAASRAMGRTPSRLPISAATWRSGRRTT
jgi:isoquinoline 1-oxidoreductase beta subunit